MTVLYKPYPSTDLVYKYLKKYPCVVGSIEHFELITLAMLGTEAQFRYFEKYISMLCENILKKCEE